MRLSVVPVLAVVLAACVASSDAQDALNSRLTLPPGLVAGVFARVGGARFMALGARL